MLIAFSILLAGACLLAVVILSDSNKRASTFKTVLDALMEKEISLIQTTNTVYRVLSILDEACTRDEGGTYFGKRIAIGKLNEQHVLMILCSDESSRLVETISELRARRALFNHPKQYEEAFGAPPDRKQLTHLIAKEANTENEEA
jgi:hypothetical protein